MDTGNGDFRFGGNDRSFAFSNQASFLQWRQEPHTPVSVDLDDFTSTRRRHLVSRTDSTIGIPNQHSQDHKISGSFSSNVFSVFRNIGSGHRYMKRLPLIISLNVAYSAAKLLTGLFTGRVGLVSDAFHLTFGSGLLTFSLYLWEGILLGYKRLEVLSAFTNALFLLFLSFSLALEALRAFMQDESQALHDCFCSDQFICESHCVWFFRNYARINLAYRNAEDMNRHSVFLHVPADSIRSAGLILASCLLSIRVQHAEVLCLGLVSVAVFMLVLPLFRATGSILLQMAPPSIPTTALSKCLRQVKRWMDDRPILEFVHALSHDLGVHAGPHGANQ